jgi:hypothetical protein
MSIECSILGGLGMEVTGENKRKTFKGLANTKHGPLGLF